MTQIEELREAARKVIASWRLPSVDHDALHIDKEWQHLMDERLIKWH